MSQFLEAALKTENPVEELSQESASAAVLANEVDTNELNDLGMSMEHIGYQLEELERAEVSLESIASAMTAAAGEEGLSRETAEAYRLAIGSVVGEALPNPVMSLESFGGGDSSRIEATELTMEAMKDTLKKIWDGIRRAIANAITAVSNFFAKLFGSLTKLKERAKAAQDKADQLKKDKAEAKEGDFTVPYASRLHLGGKIDEKTLNDGIKVVNDVLVAPSDDIVKAGEEYYKQVADAYTKPEQLEEAVKAAISSGKGRITKVVSTSSTAELPGGKAFMTTESESEGEVTAVPVPKLTDYAKSVDFNGKADIKTPSLDWASKTAGAMMKLVEHLEGEKKAVEGLKKAREEVVKGADELVKKSDSGKLGEGVTKAQVRMAMYAANRDFNSALGKLNGYIFNYVRNVLSVVEAVNDAHVVKKAG